MDARYMVAAALRSLADRLEMGTVVHFEYRWDGKSFETKEAMPHSGTTHVRMNFHIDDLPPGAERKGEY
jgi:hypothetical protein